DRAPEQPELRALAGGTVQWRMPLPSFPAPRFVLPGTAHDDDRVTVTLRSSPTKCSLVAIVHRKTGPGEIVSAALEKTTLVDYTEPAEAANPRATTFGASMIDIPQEYQQSVKTAQVHVLVQRIEPSALDLQLAGVRLGLSMGQPVAQVGERLFTRLQGTG